MNMRKIILLFILASGMAKGQTQMNVVITSVTDTVNVGDSLAITFTANFAGTYAKADLYVQSPYYYQNCMNLDGPDFQHIRNNPNGSFTYMVKITPAMGTGYSRIYSNATPSPGYKPFYIRPVISIGINELSKYQNQEKTYYDLMGNQIESRTNELIIEQIGTRRRKVYIKE